MTSVQRPADRSDDRSPYIVRWEVEGGEAGGEAGGASHKGRGARRRGGAGGAGSAGGQKRGEGKTVYEEEFYAVAVCSGLHNTPHVPTCVAGMETFTGRAVHSADYQRASDYKGNRVLIVGSGETAMDIASQVRVFFGGAGGVEGGKGQKEGRGWEDRQVWGKVRGGRARRTHGTYWLFCWRLPGRTGSACHCVHTNMGLTVAPAPSFPFSWCTRPSAKCTCPYVAASFAYRRCWVKASRSTRTSPTSSNVAMSILGSRGTILSSAYRRCLSKPSSSLPPGPRQVRAETLRVRRG